MFVKLAIQLVDKVRSLAVALAPLIMKLLKALENASNYWMRSSGWA
jgi:hypothetical protein